MAHLQQVILEHKTVRPRIAKRKRTSHEILYSRNLGSSATIQQIRKKLRCTQKTKNENDNKNYRSKGLAASRIGFKCRMNACRHRVRERSLRKRQSPPCLEQIAQTVGVLGVGAMKFSGTGTAGELSAASWRWSGEELRTAGEVHGNQTTCT